MMLKQKFNNLRQKFRELLEEIKKSILYNLIILHYKYYKSKKNYNKKNNNYKEIIVSLTTIPSRIDKVWITIESIMRQSYQTKKIILYLGKEKFQNIVLPEEIKNQQKRGLEIKYCNDLISHTKYYYSMKEYRNSFIITIDDDILYPKNMIKDLIKTYKKYPNCIICHRAHEIKFNINNNIEPYNKWNWGAEGIQGPSHLLLQTGVSGVLYPPNSLDEEVFKKEKFIKLCPKADDVWLNFMALKKGTKIVKVRKKSKLFYIVDGTQDINLNSDNVLNNGNDKQINNLINEYKITKKDFLE